MHRIIRNGQVFNETYIPPTLRVRREEAWFLIEKLSRRLMDPTLGPEVIAVFGAPGRSAGVGKTTIARYAAEKAAERMRKKGLNVVPVYINVYPAPTLFNILSMIVKRISRNLSIQGSSAYDGLKTLVDFLYYKDLHLIIILDEFQSLINHPRVDDAHLYALLRIYEQVPAPDGIQRISYILVASDYLELSKLRSRMPQVESQISYRLKLDPYTAEELYEILRQRAEEGLEPGTWDDDILWMIADYFGYSETRVDGIHDGNARRAILALRTAAELAEIRGAQRITEEHVRRAIASDIVPSVSESELYGLSVHELLVLLAVALHVRRKGGYATTGQVRRMYEELAEMYSLKPRKHTQFNEYIEKLDRLGVIVAKPSGKGMRGRTTLISLPSGYPPSPS